MKPAYSIRHVVDDLMVLVGSVVVYLSLLSTMRAEDIPDPGEEVGKLAEGIAKLAKKRLSRSRNQRAIRVRERGAPHMYRHPLISGTKGVYIIGNKYDFG